MKKSLEAASPLPQDLERETSAPPEQDFRRRAKPVPVRPRRPPWGRLWRSGWKPALGGSLVLALGLGGYALLFHSHWFVLTASDQIAVVGAQHTGPGQVHAVFAADLGRNVFFIPLAARRHELEQIPWVEHAAVLRLWPNRLQVHITERTPIAFARAAGQLLLVDGHGVLLRQPRRSHFDFPVLSGLAGATAGDANTARWLARRQPQIAQFLALQSAVGGAASAGSRAFSEINLRDPGDLQVRLSLPGGGSVLIHFGDRNFGPRYQLFLSQIAAWRQKYPNLVSVDLHFDGQAIVDPGTAAPPDAKAAKKPGARPAKGHGAQP